jgi:hypothetical protein
LITRVPFPAKTSSNAVVNVPSRSRIKNLKPPGPLAEIHEQVPGLLGGPGPGRMRGDTRDVHGPGLDLHHEQRIQALEKHGIDGEVGLGRGSGLIDRPVLINIPRVP